MITEGTLKEFKAESKKWLDDGLGFLTTPIKYVELLELTERLIAAEKDAARYRWLRDVAVEHDLCISVSLEPSEWNSFIDEAISVNQA